MFENLPIESILLLLIGGIIGAIFTYLSQNRLFKRQDKEKLSEVYEKLYPLLKKAKIRNIPEEFEKQWPGEYWLTTAEILEIDALFAKNYSLIPRKIRIHWKEAKERGPPLEGPEEAESDEIWHVYDLEKMYKAIEKEINEPATHVLN